MSFMLIIYIQSLLLSEMLQYTDEEVALHYDEFYEDVHTEFLKFGELVNFKVCRNASAHLRGNVYVHYQSLDSAIASYNAINGRYFAGKQITCEFIGVTRWKVAICGEYMKSRHRTCSHGSACNFLHCFRNPGGEYEWADWDNPPPRSWLVKMDMLFGGSRIDQYDNRKLREHDNWNNHGYSNRSSYRRSSRQRKLRERDSWSSDDSGTKHKEYTGRKYSSEEERDTRSDLDQASDVYNRKENKRRCNQNRGASDKTERGEKEISEEDKEITDRSYRKTDRSMHGMNRKRHRREHSCEDDNVDKKRRVDNVDSDLAGRKYSESRRGSCTRLDDDHHVVKYKEKDRDTNEREDDLQCSRSEKERRPRESRRPQDHVKESMDEEKIKSSRRGHHSSKSPRKHREYERVQRRHEYCKSPRRVKNYNQLERRGQGKIMSPENDQRRSKLPKRSRDFSRTPKSSDEDSLDGVDRWQASDDSVL